MPGRDFIVYQRGNFYSLPKRNFTVQQRGNLAVYQCREFYNVSVRNYTVYRELYSIPKWVFYIVPKGCPIVLGLTCGMVNPKVGS